MNRWLGRDAVLELIDLIGKRVQQRQEQMVSVNVKRRRNNNASVQNIDPDNVPNDFITLFLNAESSNEQEMMLNVSNDMKAQWKGITVQRRLTRQV